MEDFQGNSVTFSLGGAEYKLDYTMASMDYLAQKYGDVSDLFKKLRKGLDAPTIELIADMLYAGMLVCDNNDEIKSPISAKKIMAKMHIADTQRAAEAITKAFAEAMPVAKDPTKAGETPAKV